MIARGSDAEIRVEPARRRAHETKIVMLVGPRSRVRPTRGAFAALASLSERASAGRSCFRTARGRVRHHDVLSSSVEAQEHACRHPKGLTPDPKTIRREQIQVLIGAARDIEHSSHDGSWHPPTW